MMIIGAKLLVPIALFSAVLLPAQEFEFEAVSIKPNLSGSSGSSSSGDGSMLVMTNNSLLRLIQRAWGFADYQISGPDWLATTKFDISARSPAGLPQSGPASRTALQSQMQKMLAIRFGLVAHIESRPLPVYGLVASKTGVKFRQSAVPDTESVNVTNGRYDGSPSRMSSLAQFLAGKMDLPVIDMTGLSGSWDLSFTWNPNPTPDGTGISGSTLLQEAIRSAIEDQLGLRLESRKAPIDVLVIDRVEKTPTEN